MDNLTHSLIGLVAGETAARTIPGDSAGLAPAPRRGILLAIGIVGGNLPDLDLLWSMPAFTGDSVGYLLEHRGYTHTLLGCALLAALLYGGTLLYLRFKALHASARDRLTFALMAMFSVLLHLGMDALNVYGVHPFWPWDNHWFYGDAVFIVEPLYWLATAPLLFLLRTTAARVVLTVILVLGAGAVLFMHRFAPAWWLVPMLALGAAIAARRGTARTAALASAATMLVIAGGFMAGTQVAARRIDAIARQHFPEATLDTILSPNPTNPFCWDVLLVQLGSRRYVVRRGLLSIASPPSAAACSQLLVGRGTAPMSPVPLANSTEMLWLGEFSATAASLRALVAGDCAARELMQFVRAPFTAPLQGGTVLGDLRFDREAGVGMAEMIAMPGRTGCRYNAPWIAPRTDVLGQSGAE